MPRIVANSNHGTLMIPPEIERQLLDVDMLPVSQLIIDPQFQRPSDPTRQNKMAKDWNWLACGQLVVSLRRRHRAPVHSANNHDNGNVYSVLDGQQRLGSIIQLGYSKAPCRIYVDLTEKQEAELFELLNNAKKPTFNDLFKSRLMRGEETAKSIQLATNSVGWNLDPERKHSGARYIQSMAEMERMFVAGKSNLIMETLRFINDVWPSEVIEKQQMVLAGVSLFLQRYQNKVRIGELKQKLRRAGQTKLVQNALQYAAARGHSSSNIRGVSYSEAMLNLYNYNRQDNNRVKSVQS
jgi:hypothetical protein